MINFVCDRIHNFLLIILKILCLQTFTFWVLTHFTMFVNHISYYFVTFSITNKYTEWLLCKSYKNILSHKLFPFSKQSNFIYSDYFLSCTLPHPEQLPLHPQPQHPLPSFFFLCIRYRTKPPYPNIIARIKTFIILFHRLSVFYAYKPYSVLNFFSFLNHKNTFSSSSSVFNLPVPYPDLF